MNESVFFAKVFDVTIRIPDTEDTFIRQLLIRKCISTNPDVESQLVVETTTLDGKQIVISKTTTVSKVEESFNNYTEEVANAFANTFCLRTLKEVNEMQDINFKVEGVGYDRLIE